MTIKYSKMLEAQKAEVRAKRAINNIRQLESDWKIEFSQAKDLLKLIKNTCDIVYGVILSKK